MLGRARRLAVATNDAFTRAHGGLLSGALAFQGVLSLAPLLVVAVAVAGLAFGAEAAQGELERNLAGTVGAAGGRTIAELVAATSARGAGPLATVLGGLGALLGASALFGQLQETLNLVWGVNPKVPAGFRGLALSVLGKRLIAFGFVMLIGLGLLTLLVAKTALATASRLTVLASPFTLLLGELGASIAVQTALFAVAFRFLPDGTLAWRHAFWGGLLSAIGVALSTLAVGLYLANLGSSSTYGAAGAVTAILLWAFVSSYVFLWGASFTVAHAKTLGQGVVPEAHATLVSPDPALSVAERHGVASDATAWPLHQRPSMQGRTRAQQEDDVADSTWAAVARVAEAGTKMVADRIDLAGADVAQRLERTATRLALGMAAGAIAFVAWLLAMAAAFVALDAYLSKTASLAIVAGANALLAAVLFTWMARVGKVTRPAQVDADADADARVARPDLLPSPRGAG